MLTERQPVGIRAIGSAGLAVLEPLGAAERTARRRLEETRARYGDAALLITAGSRAGLTVADLIWSISPAWEVAYLETDLGFPERRRAIEDLAKASGARLTILRSELSYADQEERYGSDLWVAAPDTCCYLRRTTTIQRALVDRPAWISAAVGGPAPADPPAARFGRPCLRPIADWQEPDLTAYLRARGLPDDLPVEADGGLACAPCTRLHRGPEGAWRADPEPGRSACRGQAGAGATPALQGGAPAHQCAHASHCLTESEEGATPALQDGVPASSGPSAVHDPRGRARILRRLARISSTPLS